MNMCSHGACAGAADSDRARHLPASPTAAHIDLAFAHEREAHFPEDAFECRDWVNNDVLS